MRPGCNFFMWDDDAQLRETAVQNATEVVEREELPPRPISTQKRLTSFGYQVTPGQGGRQSRGAGAADSEDSGSGSGNDERGVVDTPCPPSNKRKRNALEDDDEFDLDELSSDEERQLAAMADATPNSVPRQGAAAPPGVGVTPGITRTVDRVGGLPTPSVARTLFPEANSTSSKRQKTVSFEDRPGPSGNPTTATATSSGTPTKSSSSSNTVTTSPPIKSSDSPSTGLATPSAQSSDAHGSDDKTQIMNLLQSQNMDPAVLSTIGDILDTSARKTKGLVMSRDSTRSLAREKDLKISRLQERVTSLENKDRMNQREITDMKAKLIKIYQDH